MTIPNPQILSSQDIMRLYVEEQRKTSELQKELEFIKSQSKTYARELSNIYQHSKLKKKELAVTNLQLVKFASDLRTTYSSLKKAHEELQNAYRDTIYRLVRASEYKDKDTGTHISRISRYSMLLAQKLGLTVQDVETIGYAAPMHDVGKIGIPDSIILKNGRLTDSEFSIIKEHTVIGALILDDSKAPVLQTARTIALHHHEHWNGTGYPSGLCRELIPLYARIVAVTDTFDALTSRRPYKSPYPIDISCTIISNEKKGKFDPDIVDAFVSNIQEFVTIKKEIDEAEPVHCSTNVVWSERDLADGIAKQPLI